MTETLKDWGHLLPDEDWAAVVAAAEVEAQRIAAGHVPAEAPARGMGAVVRFGTGALLVSGQVTAPNNGGRRKLGAPRFGVLHSAETPLQAGYAASIARYFRDRAPTSCHYMTDPAETWGVLPDELVAWHVGNANPNSLALEQAGYARMSRAEWTNPEGLAQLDRNAVVMRAARDRYGIGLYWMTDQQLRDAHAGRIVGGWATHDQCRRVIGGTSHTDPGGGFPYDLQMEKANGGAPVPAPAPAPVPTPPPAPAPRRKPVMPAWTLNPGQYLGHKNGPAASIGGYYGPLFIIEAVQCAMVLLGCVPGVDPSRWESSTWSDGVWEDATSAACRTLYARFDFGNERYTDRLYREDYEVLRRLVAAA